MNPASVGVYSADSARLGGGAGAAGSRVVSGAAASSSKEPHENPMCRSRRRREARVARRGLAHFGSIYTYFAFYHFKFFEPTSEPTSAERAFGPASVTVAAGGGGGGG